MPKIIALVAVALALASPAAADWLVLPAASWASDSTVTVYYELHDGSCTGPLIGTGQTLAPPPPWSLTAARAISDAAYVGTGRTVCAVAKARRGSVESVEVSRPFTFLLDPPVLSHP